MIAAFGVIAGVVASFALGLWLARHTSGGINPGSGM